jgi:ComF family protein
MREAIHALKYDRRRDTVPILAGFLAAQLAKSRLTFDLMTSVPLHPLRQVERGYNQAELLARETARLTHSSYASLLERTRATTDQIGLDGAARRLNVRDAFRASRAPVQDRAIILIDDVCTTGATLDACATALFESGARAVYGLALARPRAAF